MPLSVPANHRSPLMTAGSRLAGRDDVGARERSWPPALASVVEITAGGDGVPPRRLLESAYEASRQGTIALALTNVPIPAVNRILDRVVPLFPLDIPGVRYFDTHDRALLTLLLDRAEAAFGETLAFRAAAAEAGFAQPIPFPWQFGHDYVRLPPADWDDGSLVPAPAACPDFQPAAFA